MSARDDDRPAPLPSFLPPPDHPIWGTAYWRNAVILCVVLAALSGPVLYVLWDRLPIPEAGVAPDVALTLKPFVVGLLPFVLTISCLAFVRRAVDEIDRGTAPLTGIRTVDAIRSVAFVAIGISVLWVAAVSRWENDRRMQITRPPPPPDTEWG